MKVGLKATAHSYRLFQFFYKMASCISIIYFT